MEATAAFRYLASHANSLTHLSQRRPLTPTCRSQSSRLRRGLCPAVLAGQSSQLRSLLQDQARLTGPLFQHRPGKSGIQYRPALRSPPTKTSLPLILRCPVFRMSNSEDHRGTPEAPGRVVTLIERDFWTSIAARHDDTAPERVWGVAYRIRRDKVAEVKDYLDIREINGYTIHYADFQPASAAGTSTTDHLPEQNGATPRSIKTLVYIGTPTNPQFTGYQEPQALAEHIYESRGPSGTNREYLLNLEMALDALAPPESGDAHITDLCDRIRKIDSTHHEEEEDTTAVESVGTRSGMNGGSADEVVGKNHFRRRGSVIEQEETEK